MVGSWDEKLWIINHTISRPDSNYTEAHWNLKVTASDIYFFSMPLARFHKHIKSIGETIWCMLVQNVIRYNSE